MKGLTTEMVKRDTSFIFLHFYREFIVSLGWGLCLEKNTVDAF